MIRFLTSTFRRAAEPVPRASAPAPPRADTPARTGHERALAATLASPLMAGNEYLAEDEVDRATLAEILSRAFLRVEFDQDGDVLASDLDSPRVLVCVDAPRRIIRLQCCYRFRDGTDPEVQQALAQRANETMFLVKFRSPGRQVLLAEYPLFFEKGLLACQFVQSVRLVARIAGAATRECDPGGILE